MKRAVVFMFIAVLAVYSLSAQNRNERRQISESVNIEGNLKLERGLVAVESADTVYIVPLLTRYIGFINELKEGARVSVEGISFRNFILPSKVTIADKTYDFNARASFANANPANINSFRQKNNGINPGQRDQNVRPGRENRPDNRSLAPERSQRKDGNPQFNRGRRQENNLTPPGKRTGCCECSVG